MCGIAGIIGRVSEPNRAALVRMGDSMAHRGPDGSGFWSSLPDARGFGTLLAHRRLSILDLSPAAAQPMIDAVSGDVIAFNGEVYNYSALRRDLTRTGERFESSGDTAVVLRMLSREGAEAVRAFRGMFAFAFFDVSTRNLVLARDPLGIKPLYIARNPDPDGEWTIVFASEVRALLASGLLGMPRLEPRAVASVVWSGFVAGQEAIVAGVESLGPGEFRVLDGVGRPMRTNRYWTAAFHPQVPPMTETEVATVLRDSVRLHLISDVPLAVFLSSGVDSSAVANLAHAASDAPVHTFTLAFEEREFDEGTASRRIASALGTNHHEVILTESQFVRELDGALDALDQPTFDGLNSYYLSRAVRDAGFKVALVGTGGDELFGGYTSFRHLPALHAWTRRFRRVPAGIRVLMARMFAAALTRGGGPMRPQARWAKLPEMVRRGDDLVALYQLAYALFLPDFQERLLAGGGLQRLSDGLPAPLRERLLDETRGRSPLSSIAVLEERLFLGERLLRDSDAASMAASLEMRLPLVDRVVFEHVDRMSDGARYSPLGRKEVLRRIGLAGLDRSLFERPKRGFVLPFDRWIRRSLGKVIHDTLADSALVRPTGLEPAAVEQLARAFRESTPGLYWSRLWAIYVLVRWCHRHRVYL